MKTKTTLMPYQQEAVDKLLPLRVGALYMEMGTGKTRTALEMISVRNKNGKLDKVLWLCPCSVKDNLKEDLNKHADDWQDLIRIEGIESLSGSDRLYLDLTKYVGRQTMVIVDESNLVKNYFAKRTKRITELGKVAKYRMILNGTPISKNEADLYAQWLFLDPRIFGYRTFWSFAANHLEYDERHRVRNVLDTDYLAERIAPYSYIARKKDVLKLPKKLVENKYFHLTSSQNFEYEETLNCFLGDVDEFNETTIYRLFNALQLVTSGQRITSTELPMQHEPMFLDPKENPRIKALMQLLEANTEKTIIWVKYVHEAYEIQKMLPGAAMNIGDRSVKKRADEIERFRSDPDCLYLISNKTCGGYGLNLQFCHKAIYYNNDFDWATRAQSEDRIHRLGQTDDCQIISIVANSKIDERITNCLDRKENLCDAVKKEIKSFGKESLKDYLSQ